MSSTACSLRATTCGCSIRSIAAGARRVARLAQPRRATSSCGRRRPRSPRPCARRWTASTASSTWRPRSGSARACTRSTATPTVNDARHRGPARGGSIERAGASVWSWPRRMSDLRRGPLPTTPHGGTLAIAGARSPTSSAGRLGARVADDGRPLEPLPTPETKPPGLASVYALIKYDQERHVPAWSGAAYGMPTVALRFFNVYGPRPGALEPLHRRAGDLRLAAAQRPPAAGLRGRPAAARLRPRRTTSRGPAGWRWSSRGAARPGVQHRQRPAPYACARSPQRLAARWGARPSRPEITGKYRVGDIRHCFADIGAARARCSASSRSVDPRRRAWRELAGLARRAGGRWTGARGRATPSSRRRGLARMSAASMRRRPMLVTGGAGFIGTNLADRLRPDGPPRARLRQSARGPAWSDNLGLAARSATATGSRSMIADVRDARPLAPRRCAARPRSSTSPPRSR